MPRKRSPQPTRLRLVAVLRVSRRNGREGDSFLSPDEQREHIERWAAANGAVIIAWFDETDSVSGGTTDREGLRSAMTMALGDESDGIIVAKVDRFARNVSEGLLAVGKLREAGKAFVAAKEGVNSLDSSAAGSINGLILHILFALAEWQRESLKEGWAHAVETAVLNGVASIASYGYERGPDRRLVIVPDEAKVVVRIFTERAGGATWRSIADGLNAEGVPAPRGGLWVHNSCAGICRSRVYLGELWAGDFVNATAHDPVVSADLWHRVDTMSMTAKPRRESEASPYVLAGMIRCASCGGRMRGETHRYKPGKQFVKEATDVRYYRCRASYSWGKCSAPCLVRADAIEDYVVDQFKSEILSARATPTTSTAGYDKAQSRLRDAEAELTAFLESPTTAEMRRDLGNEWVEKGQVARTRAVVEARRQLAAERAQMHGALLPVNLADDWDGELADDPEQRRLFLSAAYGVIAVRAAGRKHIAPADRTRIWAVGEPGIPADLPGKGCKGNMLRPIEF